MFYTNEMLDHYKKRNINLVTYLRFQNLEFPFLEIIKNKYLYFPNYNMDYYQHDPFLFSRN